MIGLIITINKYTSWFSSNTDTFTFNTLDEVQNKLVNYLTEKVITMNIDFPQELEDFEYVWFKENYLNAPFFSYKIFNNNDWSEPWDKQDIYSLVLDNIIKVQEESNINYDNLYGDPNAEETSGFYSNDGTHIDANDLEELDNKINELMDQ